MKRKFLLMLAMLMVFALAQPLTASAQESAEAGEEYPCALLDASEYEVLEIEGPRSRATAEPKDYNEAALLFELEARIKTGLLERSAEIDLTDLRIDKTKYEINRIIFFSPYFCKGINLTFYSYKSGTYAGMYAKVKLENANTLENTKAQFANADRAVAEILSQVTDEMSAEQKALVIHDYFTDQFRYDENYRTLLQSSDSYRSGGLFLDGVGVCEAYANGYKYVMSKLGIECLVTRSAAMNHAWNIIKINGEYYHVDCTWDDPIPDRIGRTEHKFFLVSDEAIEFSTIRQSQRHYNWDLKGTVVCKDTTYDTAYWVDVDSPIVLQGNQAFYVKYDQSSTKACLYRKTGGKEPVQVTEVGQWKTENGSNWTGAYSGLFLYNGRLCYNTPTQIKSITLDGSDEKVEDSPELLDGNHIYGLKRTGNAIQYLLAKSPGKSGTDQIKAVITGMELDRTSLSLEIRGSATLNVLFTPSDVAKTERVSWATDRPDIATVENGVVKAVSVGEATITATAGNGMSASCTVTVTRKVVVFADVNAGDWYGEAADFVSSRGIMTGMSEMYFGPAVVLSRAQFATILYRMSGEPEIVYDPTAFPDVGDGTFYTNAAMWAKGNGVITGYADGSFGPADDITREQMAVMMYRYAAMQNLDTSDNGDLGRFPDGNLVSPFAQKEMSWAIGKGLIQGDRGEVNPQGEAQRAQCAIIIMRFMKNL